MPKFYTSVILLINQSKEFCEKQFSVFGSKGGHFSPLMHVRLCSVYLSYILLLQWHCELLLRQHHCKPYLAKGNVQYCDCCIGFVCILNFCAIKLCNIVMTTLLQNQYLSEFPDGPIKQLDNEFGKKVCCLNCMPLH